MSKKLTRSKKLKKYQSVYNKFYKTTQGYLPLPTKSKKSEKDKKNINRNKKKSVKKLNSYQKFVKQESKKKEFNKLSGRDRLISIAKKWKKLKE